MEHALPPSTVPSPSLGVPPLRQKDGSARATVHRAPCGHAALSPWGRRHGPSRVSPLVFLLLRQELGSGEAQPGPHPGRSARAPLCTCTCRLSHTGRPLLSCPSCPGATPSPQQTGLVSAQGPHTRAGRGRGERSALGAPAQQTCPHRTGVRGLSTRQRSRIQGQTRTSENSRPYAEAERIPKQQRSDLIKVFDDLIVSLEKPHWSCQQCPN